jgi:hypothetical protein
VYSFLLNVFQISVLNEAESVLYLCCYKFPVKQEESVLMSNLGKHTESPASPMISFLCDYLPILFSNVGCLQQLTLHKGDSMYRFKLYLCIQSELGTHTLFFITKFLRIGAHSIILIVCMDMFNPRIDAYCIRLN